MRTRGLFIASVLVAAAMAVFAVFTAQRLPARRVLPIHWNAAGVADGFAPALPPLLFPAGTVLLLALLFAAIPRLEPLQDKLDKSAGLLRASWVGMLALLVTVQLAIGGSAWGLSVSAKLIFVAVGALFVVIGNVLPKSRPGFFVGIRTPWTLTSEDNWIATHRLGGKLFILAGLAMMAVGLLPLGEAVTQAVTLAAVPLAALVPVAYSWWLWRSETASRP
jgi:uncharacterized membrane protein